MLKENHCLSGKGGDNGRRGVRVLLATCTFGVGGTVVSKGKVKSTGYVRLVNPNTKFALELFVFLPPQNTFWKSVVKKLTIIIWLAYLVLSHGYANHRLKTIPLMHTDVFNMPFSLNLCYMFYIKLVTDFSASLSHVCIFTLHLQVRPSTCLILPSSKKTGVRSYYSGLTSLSRTF